MQGLLPSTSDRDASKLSQDSRGSAPFTPSSTPGGSTPDLPGNTLASERKPRAGLFSSLFGRLLHKLAFIAPGGGSLRPWLHRVRGTQIGKHVWISQLVYIDELHPRDVEIGDNCTIGYRSSIFTHFYWGRRRPTSNGRVVIEKNVFIGPHCVILPNVRIGEGAVIRAGTVVSRNVPPHAIWGLPPAELVGIATVPLTQKHTYEEFTRGMRPAPRSPARNKDAQRS